MIDRESNLCIIIMMHLTFAVAILLQRRDSGSEFAKLFSACWIIEGLRAAVLLQNVQSIGLRPDEWFAISDVTCPLATWLLVAACASLAEVKLPRWLGALYIFGSIPIVLFGRYCFPTFAEWVFGISYDQAKFYGVLGNLTLLFIPVTVARAMILGWLFRCWRKTRMYGALVATIFCVPYAVIAIAVPIQFFYGYYPEWISFAWAFRMFGFSIGLLMLRLSLKQVELDQANLELEDRVKQRTADLKQRNEELTMFTNMVSHDLRSPLHVVLSSVRMLESEVNSSSNKEHLDWIRESAGAMEGLISDLMEYSKISQSELAVSAVDLEQVIEQASQQLATDITNREAVCKIEKPLPLVLGNRAALTQVFVNLISNGIKYGDADKPIVRIWGQQRGYQTRIWVADNGVGIAKEDFDRIFEPFERAHSSDYPGTGIGLAIVGRVCSRLGGSCGVESEVGTGSKFWVELPRTA